MSVNTVNKIPGPVEVNHVIISVADKAGIGDFAKKLISVCAGVKIFSTGNTFKTIQEVLGTDWSANLKQVSDYTGQPEMQGGLVKTLDFKIYLGLLSERYNSFHAEDLDRTGAVEIDMVVGNLYPFKETVSASGSTIENARGNIDIGGPCMLRAAAKNFHRVASVCDPVDYSSILQELESNSGCISLQTRYRCAKKAFSHTAEYDAAISTYLNQMDYSELESLYSIE